MPSPTEGHVLRLQVDMDLGGTYIIHTTNVPEGKLRPRKLKLATGS